MSRTPTNGPAQSWPELAFEGWMLAAEMGAVVWLRSQRIMAGGPLAEREARRMVGEKISAGLTLLPAALAGADLSPEGMAGRALAHYARPVRANRRRLSRTHGA